MATARAMPPSGPAWYALQSMEGPQLVYSGSSVDFLKRYQNEHRHGRVFHTQNETLDGTNFSPLFVLTGFETERDAVKFESKLSHGSDPAFWNEYCKVEPSCQAQDQWNRGQAPARMQGRPSPCLMEGTPEDMLVRAAVLSHVQLGTGKKSPLTLHTSLAPAQVLAMAETRGVTLAVDRVVRLVYE